jgi:hypothetical protein
LTKDWMASLSTVLLCILSIASRIELPLFYIKLKKLNVYYKLNCFWKPICLSLHFYSHAPGTTSSLSSTPTHPTSISHFSLFFWTTKF